MTGCQRSIGNGEGCARLNDATRDDECTVARIHLAKRHRGSINNARTSDVHESDAALAHVAKVGYDPDFGARPLKRVLQREVVDPIALALLKGEYADGDVVVVDATSDATLSFTRKAPVPSA